MTAKGFLAMLVLSLVLIALGAVAALSGGTAVQLVGGVLLGLGAFSLVGSARVRGRRVRELQRRRDSGELV